MKRGNHIYLDHAAGTSLLPEVRSSISSFLEANLANPSSIHTSGRESAAQLDKARLKVAHVLGCKASEIIFTSGGTEANNLAIKGLANGNPKGGKHIISCGTEHPSVMESVAQLVANGYEVTYLVTDSSGQINLDELNNSIRHDTCLISLMWVNNETGLIHPIEGIGKIASEQDIPFHCDGVQAFGHFPIRLDELSMDTLSFSGHKIGAPAGIGILFLRKGNILTEQQHGGHQEQKHRPGTQNTLGAIAISQAMEYHQKYQKQNMEYFESLQYQLREGLGSIPGIQFNRKGSKYSPHILSCSFHGVDGESLFIRLDMSQINVSNGSACSSGSQSPSHVLTSLGMEKSLALASLRVSLGLDTTPDQVEQFCTKLGSIIHSIQRKPNQ